MNDTPAIGHNSVAVDKLRAFVERVEKVEADLDDLKEDRKSIYSEAKSNGFDVAAIRKIVALRKQDQEKLKAKHAILELYGQALGIGIFA